MKTPRVDLARIAPPPRVDALELLVDVAQDLDDEPLERARRRYRRALERCDELGRARAPLAEHARAWTAWARVRAAAADELEAAGEELERALLEPAPQEGSAAP